MTRSTQLANTKLAAILTPQYQAISRGQALASGMTESALAHRLRAGGPWQRLLPGVFLAVAGTPTDEQRNVAAARGVGDVRIGIRSSPEADFKDLLSHAKLPMPQFNPRLYIDDDFIASPDAWWQQAGVAAEVDSSEYHLSPDDHERTLAPGRADENTRNQRAALHPAPSPHAARSGDSHPQVGACRRRIPSPRSPPGHAHRIRGQAQPRYAANPAPVR